MNGPRALISELVRQSSVLQATLEKHELEFGELLPHVFLADVARLLLTWCSKGIDASRTFELAALLATLDEGFATGGDEIRELIAVSFLENLDASQVGFNRLYDRLGPHLTWELARMANDETEN